MVKSVNILVAIRWVAKAWLEDKEETFCKYFCKADVLDSMSVFSQLLMKA